MRVHCLEHGPTEPPAGVAAWAADRGHQLQVTRLYEPHTLPAADSFDLLIPLGGQMGIYEEEAFPWLRPEKRWLKEMIAAGKPVFGICLGAQLIAEVLGARVFKGPEPEVGWWPVKFNDAAGRDPLFAGLTAELSALQWHGDHYDLPQGATLLASSAAYSNQVYRVGDDVLALQFHPEIQDPVLAGWIKNSYAQIPRTRYVQTADEMLGQTANLAAQEHFLGTLLDRFIDRRG